MRTLCRISLLLALVALLSAATGIVVLTQPWTRPTASVPPAVEPQRLEAHVRHFSETLFPRSHEHPAHLDRAAQYVFDHFKAAGATPSFETFTVRGIAYKNVVARFGPNTGALMVIGAHYDTHGHAGAPGAPTPQTHTPGADDNASGVAGLLELARLLGKNPPPHPVELVAYTLEEPPYFRTENMGSARHARALREAGREVRLMLSLEMIGYFSDVPGSQHFPVSAMRHLYTDRGDFIGLVGRLGDFGAMRRVKSLMSGATDLPVRSINAPPRLHGIDFSDHLNYWNEGMPAIMVTDTSFMRNLNYHRATDTADTLDPVRMAKVVQGVFAVTQMF